MKNIIISGGTSGLGYETAKKLAEDLKNKIFILGKNESKGEKAILKLKSVTKNPNIIFIKTDLSSVTEIKSLCSKLNSQKFDILINNAGALYFSRIDTIDNIEKTFALNHLSYFALTNLLLQNKNIKRGGRIINVASGAHKGVDIDINDLEMKKNYNGWVAYKKSKLCNILFTRKLSEFTSNMDITVNCLHPGFVKTEFGKNNMGFLGLIIKLLMNIFAIKVEDGAKTILYLVKSKDVKAITGKYFYKSKIIEPSSFAQNPKRADQLWDESIKILKNKGLTLKTK